MQKKPTLHDVAARSGVSPRTVSRVVNDESGFSEETRRRVLAAIAELGYRPNLAARSLITRRTKTIGLVVTDLSDPFVPELAQGVVTAGRARGYTFYIAASDDAAEIQAEIFDSLVAHGVEAIIVFPAMSSDASLIDTADSGTPLVVVDHDIEHPNIEVVCSDIRGGAHMATHYLVEQGHQRIGMLASSRSPERRRWREQGYRAALAEAGLAYDERLVVRSFPNIEGGRSAMRRILEGAPDVTAVFAYNDLMAIGAIGEAAAAGLRIPEDIAVVGFDDIPLTDFMTPSITTIRLDRERVGQEAVAVAIRLAEDAELDVEPTLLDVALVMRNSA